MSMIISWRPLLLGESPGDAALGGWRPLHPSIFHKKVLSSHFETPNLFKSIHQLGKEITRRNLESAIQFVATMVSIRNRVIA